MAQRARPRDAYARCADVQRMFENSMSHSGHCRRKSHEIRATGANVVRSTLVALEHEPLDGVLNGRDLALQLARLARGHTDRDDGASDVAGASQGSLGGNEDVGDVLSAS